MIAILQPVVCALFLWWFSTGLIIWLDGLPRQTFRWSLLGATVLFAGALCGIRLTADRTTIEAAYQAFGCGLLAWAWHEITFYMGWVTGPRKERCAEDCSGWRHFLHAIQASLWHEIAIIVSGSVLAVLTWKQPNQIALWTYLVLWGMHQSAKLNVFLGVRNLNEHFLPEHLDFLRSFLRQRPMNLLFPVSITVSSAILVILIRDIQGMAPGSFEATGHSFVAALLGLAIIEHWFLILPVNFAALWNWSLHRKETPAPFQVDVVAGFLGAGKTTVMRRLLGEAAAGPRTLVLANDLSELGIDASLLAGRGAEVVELPGGCVCCSLQKDLARQLETLARTHRPQRVLIEPSGVADVAALIGALGRAPLADMVSELRVITVVDAAAFLGDYARMPGYFEAQARVSPLVLINKTDLVQSGSLEMIRHTLLSAHPGVNIVMSRFGQPIDGRSLAAMLPGAQSSQSTRTLRLVGQEALGLQSWSANLSGVCDPERLRSLLDGLAAGHYGHLDRVKGIAQVETGWIRFDLAGGRPAMAAHAAATGERPRVMAIGREVDGASLLQAFIDCTLPGALQHG